MLQRLSILALVLTGLTLRTCSVPVVFTDDGIELRGTDAYYHVLHTSRVVQHYPHVPGFDPRLHHPEGAAVLYPGGFHFLAATVARLVGGAAHPYRTTVVCAIFPLAVYLATCLLILWLSRRHGLLTSGSSGWTRSFVALWLYAMLPPSIYLTSVGNYDHHAFETLFLLGSLAMLAELEVRPTWKKAVCCGLALGAMELFWVQSVVFLLPFAVVAAIRPRVWLVLTVAVAALAHLAVFATAPAPAWIDPNRVSLAQPLIAVILAAPGVLRLQVRNRSRLTVIAAVAVVGCLLNNELLLLVHRVRETLFATNPFLALATESRSLSMSELPDLVKSYGLLLPAAPVLLFFALRDDRRSRLRWSLVGVFLVTLAMMATQVRFSSLFLAAFVLLGGELMGWAQRVVRRRMLLVLMTLVLVFPAGLLELGFCTSRCSHAAFAPTKAACRALRRSPLHAEMQRQGLGVLAPWDLGHWILYYCDLPTVASPMTAGRRAQLHNARAMRLFYETDMARVHRQLKRWRVGLVIALLPGPVFQRQGELLGLDQEYLSRRGEGWVFQPKIFATLNGMLSFEDPSRWPRWLQRVDIPVSHVNIDGYSLPMLVVARVR